MSNESSSKRNSASLKTGAVALGLLIATVAFFNDNGISEEERHGSEVHAIGALKTISTSQSLFREGDKDGDVTLDYGTLTELSQHGLIDEVLGSGTKHGYHFTVAPSPTTPEFVWWAIATPNEELKAAGARSFFTNQDGLTWHGLPAGAVQPSDDGSHPAGWQRLGF